MAFCVEHALILEISTGWEFEPFLMSLSCFFYRSRPLSPIAMHYLQAIYWYHARIYVSNFVCVLFLFRFLSSFCLLCFMFLILKMENCKYKMPCLHKFPVFASMCLTGFILCVGLCVCFWECLCSMWVQLVEVCSVSFESTHHRTMGCVFRK